MKLIKLKKHIENKFDKDIIERMSKDSESNLNKYIVNVICDLIEYIPIEASLKINAKNNINNYNEKCIGNIAAYISLIPYIQLKLKDKKDGYVIVTSFIEILISYITGSIDYDELNKNISNIKQTLEISDNFYNSLVMHFANNKEYLVKGINERLK